MRALIVIAHGSPYPEANDDIAQVVEILRHRAGFDRVEIAYLDLNEPDIPTAIDSAVAHGATEIITVPYFLHTGKHVLSDIPNLLLEAQHRHSAVSITMGEYLGAQDEIVDVLMERARE